MNKRAHPRVNIYSSSEKENHHRFLNKDGKNSIDAATFGKNSTARFDKPLELHADSLVGSNALRNRNRNHGNIQTTGKKTSHINLQKYDNYERRIFENMGQKTDKKYLNPDLNICKVSV